MWMLEMEKSATPILNCRTIQSKIPDWILTLVANHNYSIRPQMVEIVGEVKGVQLAVGRFGIRSPTCVRLSCCHVVEEVA